VSRNDIVTAFLRPGHRGAKCSASANLSNSRFSLSFPIPEDDDVVTAADYFNIWPHDWFTKGADVKIGMIDFDILSPEMDFFSMMFLVNPDTVFANNEGITYGYFSLVGNSYFYFYSQGDVVINGAASTHDEWWDDRYDTVNIHFTRGWNVLYYSENYDEETDIRTIISSSKNPPANAVWVLGIGN
jgi:hypothetical protein